MHALIRAVIITGIAAIAGMAQASPPLQYAQEQEAGTIMTCFYKSEESSAMTKICYYDCLGSKTATTVKSSDVCAPTIQRSNQ